MGAPKGEKYYKGYYFLGDMTNLQLEQVNAVYKRQNIDRFKNILNGITLHDYQTIGVGAMAINPRFFLGDRPGLGKTVESAALLRYLYDEHKMKKFIFVTTTDAVFQIRGELEYYTGLKVLPLIGDSKKVARILKNYNFEDFNGVIIPHSGFSGHNEINKFFANNLDEFDTLIFDESAAVKSPKTIITRTTKTVSQQMNRVVMLNGTAFETHLYDFYYQFDTLNPRLLPAVSNIKHDYCIEGGSYWGTFTDSEGNKKPEKRDAHKIIGYKNQTLLRDKIKFHFLGRDKGDVFAQIPEAVYQLETVDMSPVQKKLYSSATYDELLNSPSTLDYDFEFTPANVPKLGRTVEIIQEITGINKELDSSCWNGEQVVVYCWFRDAQDKLKAELEKRKIPTAIISGKVDNTATEIVDAHGNVILDSEREKIRQDFNNKKYAVLIINIKRALNLPSANHMIIYTLESNPSAMYQIMKRIDRNNLTDKKIYRFMIYNGSKEVERLKYVLADREFQSNLFTGSKDNVFASLTAQLDSIEKELNKESVA